MGVTIECLNDLNPGNLLHGASPRVSFHAWAWAGTRWSRIPRFGLILTSNEYSGRGPGRCSGSYEASGTALESSWAILSIKYRFSGHLKKS